MRSRNEYHFRKLVKAILPVANLVDPETALELIRELKIKKHSPWGVQDSIYLQWSSANFEVLCQSQGSATYGIHRRLSYAIFSNLFVALHDPCL